MRNLIWERKFKTIMLMIFSIILVIVSIFFFVLFSNNEERRLCVYSFLSGIVMFAIGIKSYKHIKKVELEYKNKDKNE